MTYPKTIIGLNKAPFRPPTDPVSSGGFASVSQLNAASVDLNDHRTTSLLVGERTNFVATQPQGTFTVTVASPGVFSKTAHGLVAGDIVRFTTTGTLPTGLVVGTNYYVIATGLTTNAFEVSTTYGGSAVNTSVSQTGTHTLTHVSANIIGLTRYGFRIKNTAGNKVVVKLGSGVTQVDLTQGGICRNLRRAKGLWAVTTVANSITVRGMDNKQSAFEVYTQLDATGTITGSNSANATNGKTVTLGNNTYTIKTNLTEAKATNTVTTSGTPASVRATGTITTSSTGAADGDVVTVGGVTYTFKTALTGVANQVLRTGTIDVDLTNLTSAINATSGSGTTYGTGTVINPLVSAGSIVSHVLTLTAKSYLATNGNAVALTKTSTNLTVSGALFSGGTNETVNINGTTYTFVETLDAATAYEILINGQDTSLTNLAAAITGAAGSGTTYGTGTVASAIITSSAVVSHALTLTALAVGIAANSYTLAVVGSHLSRGAATFSGGVNSIANEVHIGGSADITLTNLSEAINAGANVGVDYSTATIANPLASASAVVAHVVTLSSTVLGQSGDSIALATNEPTYTPSGSVLAGGFSNSPTPVTRGNSVTCDPTTPFNYQQLRRHYKEWCEA